MARRDAAVSVVKKGLPVPPAKITTPLLEMAHCAAADVILADLIDADGRHHPRLQAEALERILHRERVHDRHHHAHLVRGHAVHAVAGETGAAEDVPAADHDGDLHTHL